MKLSEIPLLSPELYNYHEAKLHSAQLDIDLGFKCDQIEAQLQQGHRENGLTKTLGIQGEVQSWIGLPLQTLQTPYTEIRLMLSLIHPPVRSHIVDLGCAYGRMGLVVGEFYPQVKFTGLELIHERVLEGNRVLSLQNFPLVTLVQQDLANPHQPIPVSDYYFIYDFGGLTAIQSTLERLKAIARQQKLVVIARGKGVRHEIMTHQPWLASVNPPQHYLNFSIFYS